MREKIKFSYRVWKLLCGKKSPENSPINYSNYGKDETISQSSKWRSLRPSTAEATSSSARSSRRPAETEKSSEKGRVSWQQRRERFRFDESLDLQTTFRCQWTLIAEWWKTHRTRINCECKSLRSCNDAAGNFTTKSFCKA